MIKINDTISFEEGIELDLQNEDFKDWFNENIMPKIDFSDSCSKRDEWGRPSEWVFDSLTVLAVYFTENNRYTLNKFICDGVI